MLQVEFPESVEVAIFVDSDRLAAAYTDFRFRFILEIYQYASGFCLYINECNEMFRRHRVWNTSHLYLEHAFIVTFSFLACGLKDYRYVLFVACIHSVRNKLLHLLAAAYDWNFRVNHLVDDIAAMTALVKFCCHISIEFTDLHFATIVLIAIVTEKMTVFSVTTIKITSIMTKTIIVTEKSH